MANPEHLKILKQGVDAWNQWRSESNKIIPLLGGYKANHSLRGYNFNSVKMNDSWLTDIDITDASFDGAQLRDSSFSKSNLSNSTFEGADLFAASLVSAKLCNVNFHGADLTGADFSGADLSKSNLRNANFTGARLDNANFSNCILNHTIFAETDLSSAVGLDCAVHEEPCVIGIDTLYKSRGNILTKFLIDAGLPDVFIDYLPSLVGEMKPIQYYSCFISHSTKDREFVSRLHGRMRQIGMRVWFAAEDVKAGEKLFDQIDRAIQIYDKLLLILSIDSIESEWVKTEIRRARRVEIREKRRKLFPVRLTDFETLRDWTCFDADSGKDLAVEVREYFIPDFSNWKSHDAFESAFVRLKKDLEAENSKK